MAVLCDSKLERPRSHRSTPRRQPPRRGEPEKSLTFQSRLPVVPAGLFDAPDLAASTWACPTTPGITKAPQRADNAAKRFFVAACAAALPRHRYLHINP